jgi:hypothetical protein
MPTDEIVERQSGLPLSASAAASGFVPQDGSGFGHSSPDARVPEGSRNRLIVLSLIAAVCLIQSGWLGMLAWGLLWLFGAA